MDEESRKKMGAILNEINLKIGGASGTRPAKGVINITSTGCVGINSKTNLLYPLEVRDAARIQGTVPVLYFGVGTDGAAVNKWHFAVEGADSDFTLTQSGIAAWVRVQKTTGNVCIGANQVADYKLVVKTEWGGGVIRIGAEGAWMGRIKCDTHLALETPADAGDILMLAGGTEVMRVACANKSVSIGTPGVGPVARLTLMTDDPRVMYLYRQAGVGSGWGIYSDANGNLDFTYENADKTRVGGRYRFTYDGCMIIPVANAAPADAHFEAGNQQVGLYYDTANKRLSFKLREAGGAFRTGYVQLA
jgi:hypothetical protein